MLLIWEYVLLLLLLLLWLYYIYFGLLYTLYTYYVIRLFSDRLHQVPKLSIFADFILIIFLAIHCNPPYQLFMWEETYRRIRFENIRYYIKNLYLYLFQMYLRIWCIKFLYNIIIIMSSYLNSVFLPTTWYLITRVHRYKFH